LDRPGFLKEAAEVQVALGAREVVEGDRSRRLRVRDGDDGDNETGKERSDLHQVTFSIISG
jgi:hypothetical protein